MSGARPPVALYVHFPFCLSVCPYCDFVVYGGSAARGPTNRIAPFVAAVETEIRLRAPERPVEPLRSIYLGGGTPSLLTAAQVGGLLNVIDRTFGIAGDAEITLECNPGPADRGDVAGSRAAGVNRLSIGAQSLDPGELRRLGRRHSPADVTETLAQARAAGLDNVSLDLLYDVPGQTIESWRRTLVSAVALAPEHLSLYALALGRGEPADDVLPVRAGARRWRQRATMAQDEDRAADCYILADEVLARAGYGWYEISNWARSGAESRHNLAYWTGEPWEAVGPGAHAFDGVRTRRWNAARLDGYIAALAGRELPPGGSETADEETAAAERAILRFRTAAGLPPSHNGLQAESALIWARAHGMLESACSGNVRLSLRGRLLATELFVRLLPDPSGSIAA